MQLVRLLFLTCATCGFPRPPLIAQDAATPDAASDAAPPDAGPMDFTVAIDLPRVLVVEGRSSSVDITIARNEFADAVSVTVVGLPTGVTADPLTITGSTGALTLHAASGATQGEAALTITAAGGARSHDAPLSLLAMGLPGTLDRSFSPGGRPPILPKGLSNAIAIQPDGKIVVAGQASIASADIVVARYLPDGSPDLGFSGGVVTFDAMASSGTVTGVALQPDGKIVVVGRDGFPGVVVRFKANGAVDDSFGVGGRQELDLSTISSSFFTQLNAIAVQADGGIVVAGSTTLGEGGTSAAVVARLTPTGLLDGSFGTEGRTTASFGTVRSEFLALTLQPDERIVAVGVAGGAPPSEPTLFNVVALARFNRDGRPDNSFSVDGKLTIDVGDSAADGADFVLGGAVALQHDGKIVAAGGASFSGLGRGESNACLVRVNGDNGTPDNSFGTNGVKVVSLGGQHEDYVTGVTIQPDGKFVISGLTNIGVNFYDGFVARLDVDGLLDLSFTGGLVVNPLDQSGNNRFHAIAIDGDSRIVATGYGLGQEVILSRFWP